MEAVVSDLAATSMFVGEEVSTAPLIYIGGNL